MHTFRNTVACTYNRMPIVQLLLHEGKINLEQSPNTLLRACESRNQSMVKLLIKYESGSNDKIPIEQHVQSICYSTANSVYTFIMVLAELGTCSEVWTFPADALMSGCFQACYELDIPIQDGKNVY